MEYHFNIIHKPGNTNVADYLSRNPISSSTINEITNSAEDFVNFIEYNSKPSAIKIEEIVEATRNDIIIQKVIKCIQSNNFPSDPDILSFKNIKDELSITNQGILLRDTRMVIPENLRIRATQLAHEGHQGVIKTKRLLRERIWFPNIDKMIEDLLGNCNICQLNNGGNRKEKLKMTEFPKLPWTHLSMDFFGPLPNKNELLVIKDLHSRFPIVVEVKSTSAYNVLPALDNIFSLMGIPERIKSDNGPPFNGIEFKEFCEFFGINHQKITPLWPQANGQCENSNKNLKKIIKISINNHSDWRTELNAFLRSYRSTPHSSTNKSPLSLIFINNNISRLPAKPPNLTSDKQTEIVIAELNDKFSKYKMKAYADKHRRATINNFKVGDHVLYYQLNNKIHNKYTNQFSSTPYVIKSIKGSMITVTDSNNNEFTRNSSLFKPILSNISMENFEIYEPQINTNSSSLVVENENLNTNVIEEEQASAPVDHFNSSPHPIQQQTNFNRPIRSNRNRLPARFNDFIVG